ncbi:MAG: hypothetical protein ABIV48_12400 [Pyrinomonadaceae bacterium]
MKLINLKKLASVSALAMVAILGMTDIANAQGRGRDKQNKNSQKQERKHDKQHDKFEKKHEKQHAKDNRNVRDDRDFNDHDHNGNQRIVRSGNDRSRGQGYYNGNANANTNRNQEKRYRVYRNGSTYNTDQRGADLLRQAVNEGYRQGFQAGRRDLDSNRRGVYSNSDMYRSGNYGYQNAVSQSQYQYYFRQGFQRGYQDGANTRYRNTNDNGQYNDGFGQDYNQQYQYGSSNNGILSILAPILGQILNLRAY